MDRPNLTVITQAHAKELTFDGNRATGVIYKHKGKGRDIEVKATREVLLCSGALKTPQLLQLSGVGDPEDLNPHGIEVRHALPDVDKNLQDHMEFTLAYKSSDTDNFGIGLVGGAKLMGHVNRWRKTGVSMAATCFAEGAAALRTPYQLSHGELFAKITQSANALRRLGVGQGEVAAYILPNMPETHFAIWGGSAAGGILAINPLMEADQMADLLNGAGVTILITLEQTPGVDIWEKASAAAANVPGLKHVLLCNFMGYIKGDGVWVDPSLLPPSTAQIDGCDAQITRLMDEIAGENAETLDFPEPGPDDTSTMLCTGGTTGLPKIVRRTQFGEVYNSWCPSLFVGQENVGPGTAAICGLPLFHTNAMLVTGLLPWMYGGHVVLATPGGYRGDGVIAGFWDIVEHYGISSFSGVPTIYGALLQVPHQGKDLSSLRFAACGAAPMPVELFNGFVQETGIKIVEAYGMTEGVLARQDADGYFWMTGRKKELIIRGGHNIDPKIVEEAMHKHPAVAMAAVIGRPDAKVGKVPVMYFQKAAGAELDMAELAEFAQTHVSERAAVPKDFVQLDDLPVTAVGKIHKVTLNMMEIERTIREEAANHGADIASLEVVQDSSRGIVAKLSLTSGQDSLEKALGLYAFNVDF